MIGLGGSIAPYAPPTEATIPFTPSAAMADATAAGAHPAAPFGTCHDAVAAAEARLTRRGLREHEEAVREAASSAAAAPSAPASPVASATLVTPARTPAGPVLPSRRIIRRQDAAAGSQQRGGRGAETVRTTAQPTAGRRTPLGRLRDSAATAGLVLASAGLLVGAVAPSAPATADRTDRTSGVALASGVAPAVTAPAGATVTFGLESAGPATEGIAPGVARSRALSAPLSPALAERKAFGGPVDHPVVASTFGYRVDPVSGYGSELHTGQDYASACGTPVLAADAGTVVDSGWHAYGGGHRIVIDHGDGSTTTYNHLGALDAPAGATVQRGQVVGAVGSSGNSTGCHLHFEVLINDEKVDPQPWL